MTQPLPVARTRAALLCLLALASISAGAQTAAPLPAADPHAAVPPTRYESAVRYRVETAPATRPDRNWRDSNAVVAGTGAMSMTMPDMASHGAHDAEAHEAAPETARHHHHPGMAMPPAAKETQR